MYFRSDISQTNCPLGNNFDHRLKRIQRIETFVITLARKYEHMKDQGYFKRSDLKQFGEITSFQKEMGEKFFEYYAEVFKEGALTQREKSLIALAVAHTVQCPYCIDAYTSDCLKKGADEEQMMEAVHVAAAIRSGSSLVFSVQMMNQVNQLSI